MQTVNLKPKIEIKISVEGENISQINLVEN